MMRWLAGRDPDTCESCGATLVADARWCGACGAATADEVADDHADVDPIPEDEGPAPTRGWQRFFVPGLLVVVIGGVVAAGLLRTPPAVPLLGTPAAGSGLSATGPPPDGLRLAWQHDLADEPPMGFSTSGPVRVAASDEFVAVNGRVVDRATGRLVRLDPTGGQDGLAVTASSIVRTDVLTGEQELVGELPLRQDLWQAALLGDVVALHDEREGDTVLQRTDGTEIARLDGRVNGWLDRIGQDAVLLPVRVGNPDPGVDIALVDPTDGRTVRTLVAPASGSHVVDVLDDTVLHTVTSTVVGAPGSGVEWQVALLDPMTGSDSGVDGIVSSAHAPRLLGALEDGTVLVGGRSGAEVTVWALRPDGSSDLLATTRAVRSGSSDPYGHGDGSITSQAVVAGELVVTIDNEGDVVRALDGDGAVVWRAPRDGANQLGAADGVVALVHEDPVGGTQRGVRVLDAADGTPVVTVPPGVDPYLSGTGPAAAYDGHVAIGSDRSFRGGIALSVLATRWLDLRDGDRVLAVDVLERFLPDDEQPSPSWTLHGMTTAPDGGLVPVITRDLDRGALQLLEPRIGFDTIDLDGAGYGVAGRFAAVVGMSPDHLVVAQQDFDTGEESTTIIEREGGDVRQLSDVWPITMVGDVLVVADAMTWLTAVGIDVTDGTELWRIEDGRDIVLLDSQRGEGDDLLAVNERGAVLTDVRTGDVRWRHAAPEMLWPSAAVLGPATVVLATTAGDLVGLSREDGTEVWRTSLDTPVTSLTGAGGAVVVGTVDGLVVHIDDEGREVQRVAVGTTPVLAVAALGDTVVATIDGTVVGLRPDGTGIVEQDEIDLP